MSKYLKYIFLCVITLLTLTTNVYASHGSSAPLTCDQLRNPAIYNNPPDAAHQVQIFHLECIFGSFLGTIASFIGMVVLVTLLFGGYKYITSQGDPKAMTSAKATLTFAIIGLILVVASYFIIDAIARFSGLTGSGPGVPDIRKLLIPRP